MTPLDDRNLVFIIRIWLERRELDQAPLVWRGMVEHLETGQRRYIKDLAEIRAIMVPYLVEMGIPLDPEESKHG